MARPSLKLGNASAVERRPPRPTTGLQQCCCHPVVLEGFYSCPISLTSRDPYASRFGVRIASISTSVRSVLRMAAFNQNAPPRRVDVRIRARDSLPRRRRLCGPDPADHPRPVCALFRRIREDAGRRRSCPGGRFEPAQSHPRGLAPAHGAARPQEDSHAAGADPGEDRHAARARPPEGRHAAGARPGAHNPERLGRPEPAWRHVGPQTRLKQIRHNADCPRERRDVRQSDRRRRQGFEVNGLTTAQLNGTPIACSACTAACST